MEKILDTLLQFAKTFGVNVLEAIAVLLGGILIIRLVAHILRTLLFKTKVEGTVSSFIISIINAVLALVVFFAIMKIFNLDTSSIVAIIAASGLAIGLALQNSIANVASGIILLFTKPFKENDMVKIGGEQGLVKKINITTTELLTPDNVKITIPNSTVATTSITNYSARPTRRIDLIVSASYECEVDKVKQAIMSIAGCDSKILKTPVPEVAVQSLNSSSIEYRLRIFVLNENYWDVYNSFLEKCLKVFAENNIEIPYNRIVVLSEGGAK